MSALILACIAVLALFGLSFGLSFCAIYHKVGLKVSVKALRQFEVSIEVESESGSHHGRLSTELGDDPCSSASQTIRPRLTGGHRGISP